MKTERRHSLETNELAAGLTQWIQKLKPYTGQMITGLVLFVGVYIGLGIWDSYKAQAERDAWDAFALASDTNDRELQGLQRVAEDEKFAGTKMQEWAYVGWADRQVLLAQKTYLFDRESANNRLRNSSGIYEAMAADASDAQVKNRARFGLARIYELQNKLDDARQQYLIVQGDLQPQATQRAKQLESENVREACNWLATAELPNRNQTGGQGATGTRPDFNADTPAADAPQDSGDSNSNSKSLEELLGDLNPETSSEATEEPATDEVEETETEKTEVEETKAETETEKTEVEETKAEAGPEAEAGTVEQ